LFGPGDHRQDSTLQQVLFTPIIKMRDLNAKLAHAKIHKSFCSPLLPSPA
jgi:hypothetical protein